MTLLELLVRDLERWPLNVTESSNYPKSDIYAWIDTGRGVARMEAVTRPSVTPPQNVTREQYEAALEWNGEGLPPVGTECEWIKHSPNTAPLWRKGVIQYLSACTVVIKNDDPGEIVGHPRTFGFRPIRTEADYKREIAAKCMREVIESQSNRYTENAYVLIYDAITAHKIPGVAKVPNVGEIMRATESCSCEDAQKIVDLLNGA